MQLNTVVMRRTMLILVSVLLVFSLNLYAKPVAVLFDCDGVLVDTEYLKYEAWKKALNDIGISFTIDEYMPLIGNSSKNIAAGIEKSKNISFDTTSVIAAKDKYYVAEQSKGVPAIPPAVKFLNALLLQKQNMNIKIAIVSTDHHATILRNLKFAGVKYELLDGIFSGHDDLKHINDPTGTNKPKPYIYQLAANKLDIDPKQTVVFEDTNAGLMAAYTAGMMVIAVPNRFTDKQDFSKAKLVTNFTTFKIANLADY